MLRIRRRDVERNLALAFPGRSPSWRRRVGSASYRHLGREAVTALRLAGLGPDAVVRRTRVRGLDRIRDAAEPGRGAVIVTGHVGNWEVAGASVTARGVPLAAVALRQANPLFDRELVRMREGLGLRVVYKKDLPGGALEILRQGGVVAVVGDQNPIRGGIRVDFFGRPAHTARGPAVLALRTGAALFLGVALRELGPEVRYDVWAEEIPVERTGDLESDVRRLVQGYTRRLEDVVRRAPEQYFWQHRRWKARA